MSRVDEELISLYKTLTELQKKCVRVVIVGMKLAKKDPGELTEKEKRYVGVFIQAMKDRKSVV